VRRVARPRFVIAVRLRDGAAAAAPLAGVPLTIVIAPGGTLNVIGLNLGAEPVTVALRAFVGVCEAHGRTAAQHHDQFVARFIEKPSERLSEVFLRQITASGPPLR